MNEETWDEKNTHLRGRSDEGERDTDDDEKTREMRVNVLEDTGDTLGPFSVVDLKSEYDEQSSERG